MHLAHLEEESANKDGEVESKDPSGIDGVMAEFTVHLARVMKNTQMEKKHYYHCSSLEYFICNCPLVKALGLKSHLNHKEGMTPKKGAQTPPMKVTILKWHPRCRTHMQTPFLNPDPFQHWYGVKNVAKMKINGGSCMALLNNDVQINTITHSYMKSHSLEVG